jgi:capsular exopolysaccharide synthesis family protein
MNNKQSTSDIFNSQNAEVHSFSRRQFLNKMLFHWPLYLVFLLIAFGGALFYLKFTPPLYEIHAKVLIKDYAHLGEQKAALEELNLAEPQTEKDVDAEIGLMSSIPVIEQVVTDLQLWITYQEPTKYFSYKDIYRTTPVQFKLIKPGRSYIGDYLDIIIENKDYFRLIQTGDTSERFSFKDNYINSFGTWKLDTTHFLKEYIGKTVRITLNNPNTVVKYYQDGIAETPILKSLDLDISIDDEVPSRGRAIISDLLRVYMDASIEEKRESAQNTLKFVEQRLVSITQELNNVESQYEGFKSTKGITEITGQSSVYFGNEQNNDKQISDINIKLSVIDGIERYIDSNEGADNPPATLGLDDGGVLGLIKQLSDLQLQRTKLLATLPENNPLFNPIDQQIKVTKTALRENLKGIRATLISTRGQLQAVGSNFQSSIKNAPQAERGLNDIKRMQEIKENLYTYLLQKKEQLSLDYASTISDAIIIDQPHNGKPISPKEVAVYAIAFLFGLLIPTGVLYGRNAVKNRILSKAEIVSSAGAPVLSEIIYDENEKKIAVLNQYSYIGEQFRELRTKLSYLHGTNDKGRTTLFTSSIAGEGKSFVLHNLGIVLSLAGKKTILLELDLRRPTFLSQFNMDKKSLGLTDYLIGNATKSQIIQPSAISDNLFIIASGNIPPNPSELLEKEELKDLIRDLKLEFDHILIDSPPVHLLTDAMIVAPMCDVSLYLIRQDYTPKIELEFIRELYLEKKLPRISLIFNAVKNAEYGGGYNYQKNSYIKKAPVKFKTVIKKFFSRF